MKRSFITITLLLSLLIPAIADGKEASIDKLFVGKKPILNLSFMVKDAFKEEIEEGIKSGIPTTFTFFVELYRVRGLWRDKSVDKWTFKHTVKYDNLKEEYEVTLGEFDKKIRTKDFEEMKRLMVSVEAIELTTRKPLNPESRYSMRVMAELDTIKLPFLLRHMLFFVTFWDFKTDWYVFRLAL
jgi:hypothetical protein